MREICSTFLVLGLVGIAIAASLSGSVIASPTQKRAYRIDDRFALEIIETKSLAFSSDGEALAFVRRRSALSQVTNALLIPETRDDVWVQQAPGKPAKNLTNGAADATGWWNPQWSPDGNRLAMLSTRGGAVAIWVWDRATNRLYKSSDLGVDFTRASSQVTRPNYQEVFQWVDETRLICLALPDGERASPTGVGGHFTGKAVERASEAWARAARGEVSASAVDSLEFSYPERTLRIVDVVTGTARLVATTQSGGMSGVQPSLWWLSPRIDMVAFVPHAPSEYQAADRAALGSPWPIELRRLDGTVPQLSQPLPKNVITETLRWSPDGRSLAFFAYENSPTNPDSLYGKDWVEAASVKKMKSASNSSQLWRVDVEQGRVQKIKTDDLDIDRSRKPPTFAWAATGDLIFRTARSKNGELASPAWLVLDSQGRSRPLFSQGKAAGMDSLQSIDGGARFVGVADGDVWSVTPANGSAINLTEGITRRVSHIYNFDEAGRNADVVVSIGDLASLRDRAWVAGGLPVAFDEDYVLDVVKNTSKRLHRPSDNSAIVAFDRTSDSAIYFAEDRKGTYLWRVTDRSKDLLVATNEFIASVAKGERIRVDYTTLNGEKVSALLVLPVNYKKGRRYPLVVDFDIGATRDTGVAFSPRSEDLPDTVADVFSASGYAYLFASWPTTSMDDAGRANLLLGPHGVVPAAEKVVELGIADPDRLLLYGMSSAGYGAFSLVTQTSRFKAAVASVGWVDQLSHSLTMYPQLRYTDNPFDGVWRGAFYSNYHELPFWLNAEHLRRNSPLNYVDRVRTPLMIIHSDFDMTSITQPEMFFNALILQRKPAKFVRYWGEAHGNQTPANERDMFQRIFAWFDGHGDIARDAAGEMIFEGNKVKSRSGAPALEPEDFSRFGPAKPINLKARRD